MLPTHMSMRETHTLGRGTTERLVPPGPALAAAGLFMAGLSTAGRGFRFVRVAADYPQVLVCLSGRGKAWVDGAWQPCGTGTAYVTAAGAMHAYHADPASDRDDPWRLAWVLYRAGPACPISTAARPALARVDPRPVRDAVAGLYRETITRAAAAMVGAWVGLLQLYAARAVAESAAGGAGDALWPVWDAVAADLSHRWTLAELAARAAVSPEHLRRLCQRQLGCPPMRQVTRLRMDRAATLLAGGRAKVDAVAAAVGYADRFAFAHAFRRHVGQPPGAYRRSGAGGSG